MTNLVYHAPFFLNCRTNPAQHTCEVVLIVKSVKSTATIYTAQTVLLLKLTIQSCTAHPLLKYCYLWSCVWCITSTHCEWLCPTQHIFYWSIVPCKAVSDVPHWYIASGYIPVQYIFYWSIVPCKAVSDVPQWYIASGYIPTQYIFYWSIVPWKAVSGVPHWYIVRGYIQHSTSFTEVLFLAKLCLVYHTDTLSVVLWLSPAQHSFDYMYM